MSNILMIASVAAGMVCGGILGACAMAFYVRANPTEADNVKRNAVKLLRENDELRRTVMDFVKQMRSKPEPPTRMDWERLVDAMVHEGTPYSIRLMYHRSCGTMTPEAVEAKLHDIAAREQR